MSIVEGFRDRVSSFFHPQPLELEPYGPKKVRYDCPGSGDMVIGDNHVIEMTMVCYTPPKEIYCAVHEIHATLV